MFLFTCQFDHLNKVKGLTVNISRSIVAIHVDDLHVKTSEASTGTLDLALIGRDTAIGTCEARNPDVSAQARPCQP